MDERVLKSMMPYFMDQYFNPSAAYLPAVQVRADVEEARHTIAKIIGAKSAEIIFTAGATESVNLAMTGVRGRILTSATEHQSVMNLARQRDGLILPVNKHGQIDLAELEQSITDDIEMVTIGYVNSETGVIADISGIGRVVRTVRESRRQRGVENPLYFHTDASQATGILDLNVARLGVDLMTLNASKCYGPKQVGLLYVRAGVKLSPIIVGGGQENGLRSGTENVPGIIGFAKAMEIAHKTRDSEVKRLKALRQEAIRKLQSELPDVIINQCKNRNSPSIINFSVPNVDGERVLFRLDDRGIMVSTGSACAANKGVRSHVLTAMGLDPVVVDGSIRLSLGRFTTAQELDQALALVIETVNEQRKFGTVA